MPSGSKISQNIRATASSFALHGTILNVAGSGFASISLSSIRANPFIEEPSNPIPSSNAASNSLTEIVTHFNRPRMSVNQSPTNFTPCSFTVSNTSSFPLAFISISSRTSIILLFIYNYVLYHERLKCE